MLARASLTQVMDPRASCFSFLFVSSKKDNFFTCQLEKKTLLHHHKLFHSRLPCYERLFKLRKRSKARLVSMARFARSHWNSCHCVSFSRSHLKFWGRCWLHEAATSTPGLRGRPLIDHLLLPHGNAGALLRLLCQGHYHERFEQRALLKQNDAASAALMTEKEEFWGRGE